MQYDIFISYSRRDLVAVKPVKEELKSHGFSCWMDLDGIESGEENFAKKIVPALDSCSVVLFFVSDSSQRSEWTEKELGYAGRHKKRIVPVRTNDDHLVGVFDLNYGNSNIVDWRYPEQKKALLRDLRRWTTDRSAGGPDSEIAADGAQTEENERRARAAGKRSPGRGCSVTVAVSFLAVAILGGGFVLLSRPRALYPPPTVTIECQPVAKRTIDKRKLYLELTKRGDWDALEGYMQENGVFMDFMLATEVAEDYPPVRKAVEWMKRERGYSDADVASVLERSWTVPKAAGKSAGPESRKCDRFKLYRILADRGDWPAVENYMKEKGVFLEFMLADEISEDYPPVKEAVGWLKRERGYTDEDVDAAFSGESARAEPK